MLYTGIFAIPITIGSLARTLDRLSWLSVLAAISILIAGIVGMIGAGINFPIADYSIAIKTDFVTAFISVTNPGMFKTPIAYLSVDTSKKSFCVRWALHVLYIDLGDEAS